jgi:hypothetical protein
MAVRNYLSPGALQPKSGGTGVRNYLSPGAIQPQPVSATSVPNKIIHKYQAVKRAGYY